MVVFKSKELKLYVFSLLSDLSPRRIQRRFCELRRLASPTSSGAPLLSPCFYFAFRLLFSSMVICWMFWRWLHGGILTLLWRGKFPPILKLISRTTTSYQRFWSSVSRFLGLEKGDYRYYFVDLDGVIRVGGT